MIRNRATAKMLPCNKWFVRLPTRKQSDTIASAVLGGTVQLTHPLVTTTHGARHKRLNGDYRYVLWVPSPPHRTTGTRAYIKANTMRHGLARGLCPRIGASVTVLLRNQRTQHLVGQTN